VITIANLLKEFFISLFTKGLADLLIVIGLAFIVWNTYSISILIGNYLLGTVILLIGLLIARAK